MIAGLSHHNYGAYWEAGYAEGLGKPVPIDIGRMVLTSETGRRFKVDYFRHTMRAAFDALPALKEVFGGTRVTTHGLRYTAATIMRDLDLDWQAIGDITGHRTAEMARKYADKRRRVRLSISKLNAARAGDKDRTE